MPRRPFGAKDRTMPIAAPTAPVTTVPSVQTVQTRIVPTAPAAALNSGLPARSLTGVSAGLLRAAVLIGLGAGLVATILGLR
jgi:tetrahydromethanopterin S-methyltransferase subunit F